MKQNKFYSLIGFVALVSLVSINNLFPAHQPPVPCTSTPAVVKKVPVVTDTHGHLMMYTEDYSVNVL